jgi:hypothetical protein
MCFDTTLCDKVCQVGGFLRAPRFPFPRKTTDRHDITELLLKVALNTITLTSYSLSYVRQNYRYFPIEPRIMSLS